MVVEEERDLIIGYDMILGKVVVGILVIDGGWLFMGYWYSI